MAKGKKHYHTSKKTKKERQGHSPVKAKKYLGQHFLKDETVAQRIADTLSFIGYTHVVEVGPGTGVLTKYLLEKDIDLTAMDLDSESIVYLREDFPIEHIKLLQRKGRFEVIEADFLKFDLKTHFENAPFAITGNFPYNISTQIVFRMLEMKSLVPEFSGMFQKEVAERICAKEGSKTYGILSVLSQAFYDAEYLFTVAPEVFNPPPKVQSGVLRLVRKESYHLECDEKLFFKVVKATFNQRRKTLRNSLKTFQLSDSLRGTNIFDKRPEQISVSDFIQLTLRIQEDIL
ncbi:16S rRNA (adenine(1518)-N(6)/adenine(1519)-N(6))-dimethyltransferase RsmA [Spongiimicrobium salis]|uniref:16S rRNA (adenine(1518)-N(6)/adenine(1519)-N(6))- dimethyltransferase RsmA n=1 Tax=Spongiimicrobium salis TaxID=1667022 RepID=UPI00374DD728